MDIVFSFVILFCLIFSFLFQIDDFFSFFCFFSSLTSSTFLSSFSSFSSFSLSCLFRGGHTGTKAALFPSHYSFIPYPPGVYLSVCKCVCVCVCVCVCIHSVTAGAQIRRPLHFDSKWPPRASPAISTKKNPQSILISLHIQLEKCNRQNTHTHTHTHIQ